jgi:hypothetical protein
LTMSWPFGPNASMKEVRQWPSSASLWVSNH